MSSTNEFDYIIAGGGCAGLSLAARMANNERLSLKKILIIDREPKYQNDRTWCFWEDQPGFFESIVCQSWETLDFHSASLSRRLKISPFRYKMIRSIDFYKHCKALLADRKTNVTLLSGSVDEVANIADGVVAKVDGVDYKARFAFNSIFDTRDIDPAEYIFLRQHFRGWLIQTEKPTFDPTVATLMDFRISQSDGTAFFYVLPLANDKALIEYTLFTHDLLKDEQYNERLTEYIRASITTNTYKIIEEEQGVIPMTNFPFALSDGNIFNIGTAGGQTKGSTGYTFQFIQKHSSTIVDALAREDRPPSRQTLRELRFSIYDGVMLRVLDSRNHIGAGLFAKMFGKGDPASILRFLDNSSSFVEDVAIMSRLPKRIFAGAAVEEIVGRVGRSF